MRYNQRHRIVGTALSLISGLGAVAPAAAEPRSPGPNTAAAVKSAAASKSGEPQSVPAAWLSTLRKSGVPLKDFGVHVRAVDASSATMSLNAEQPYLMASTAKVVTSLAALNLLGPTHQWRTQAHSSSPLRNGALAGDLVIVGGTMGMTPAELRRWFKKMRDEGLAQISGRIVLDGFSLLANAPPARARPAAEPMAARPAPDALNYNAGASLVVVQPTKGELASISLQPAMPGVVIVNEMLMGGASTAVCGARVRWGESPAGNGLPPLLVSGRWVSDCGRQEVAFVKLPGAGGTALVAGTRSSGSGSPAMARVPPQPERSADVAAAGASGTVPMAGQVASLWADAGGQLRGGVVEAASSAASAGNARASVPVSRSARAWTSQSIASMAEVLRELNKTSNNDAARDLLLSLAPPHTRGAARLSGAQGRVDSWLRAQGLVDGDIEIDDGSGQSRLERGRPRALVQLLLNQWQAKDAKLFVESLPIAGVDGTLANRMRNGPASGRAFMKTGTLSDTRALAGYVLGQSGKVYAVALMVNHPQAARATQALDALVEWLAKNG